MERSHGKRRSPIDDMGGRNHRRVGDPGAGERAISDAIDSYLGSIWEAEDSTFQLHHQPERVVRWKRVAIGTLKKGEMVYKGANDPVGMVLYHAEEPKHGQGRRKNPEMFKYTAVQHPHHQREYDQTTEVVIRQTETKDREPCDCVPCNNSRERRQFLAGLETKRNEYGKSGECDSLQPS